MKSGRAVAAMLVGAGMLVGTVAANAQSIRDKRFLRTASQINYNNIALAKLALRDSPNEQVKDFAREMIHDHSQFEDSLKPYLHNWGVREADSMDRAQESEYNRLKVRKGKDFDMEYMRAMEVDHMKAMTAFKDEDATTHDAQFKQTVEQAQQVIAKHEHMADQLGAKVGVQST